MQNLIWAEISSNALNHNFQICKHAANNAKIITVIKANAYGHGALTVAKTLNKSDYFAVARIDEAMQLRDAGITSPIMVLSGILLWADILCCIEHDLDAVIHSKELCLAFKKNALPGKIKIWLKVDTGMHRLGLSSHELNDILGFIEQTADIQCLGVLSHLSSADEAQSPSNKLQQQRFEKCLSQHQLQSLSIANSAALLHHKNIHFDYVRPGIMLYGVKPSHEFEHDVDLKAVMTLKAKILNTREIEAGESVGYNGKWKANQTSHIATISAGYADGYPRHAKDGTPVLINGQFYPLVGRVSMDLITVDITTAPELEAGTEVTLWGEGLPVEVIATHSDTIAYQLLTAVSDRVPRILI
ncbi:MAG: alanine racemase [Pseudomonadales bacterium]|nr:alanine racemase [Pseudomonadales bacterium]